MECRNAARSESTVKTLIIDMDDCHKQLNQRNSKLLAAGHWWRISLLYCLLDLWVEWSEEGYCGNRVDHPCSDKLCWSAWTTPIIINVDLYFLNKAIVIFKPGFIVSQCEYDHFFLNSECVIFNAWILVVYKISLSINLSFWTCFRISFQTNFSSTKQRSNLRQQFDKARL